MSNTRIIKKYPNRRLYDTDESRYITLTDIRDLVRKRVNFAVIDKKTDANITCCVLLQVICEQEQNGEAIMSEGFLSQVVRVYGNADAAQMADHLEGSLIQFMAQQDSFCGGCNGDTLPRPLLQCLKGFTLHGGPPAQAGGHFFCPKSERYNCRI